MYSYSGGFNGFAASLSEEEVEILSGTSRDPTFDVINVYNVLTKLKVNL